MDEPEHSHKVAYTGNDHQQFKRLESIADIEQQFNISVVLQHILANIWVLKHSVFQSYLHQVLHSVHEFADIEDLESLEESDDLYYVQ